MMHAILLHLVFLLLALVVTFTKVNCIKILESNSEKLSWMNAQKKCVGDGGNLLVMDEAAVESVHRCNLTFTERVWEGRYNTFSPWVIVVGCSSYDASGIQSSFTMAENGAIQCGEKCLSSNSYALKGNECYCLKPSFNFADAGDRQCPIRCSTRGEPCGGASYMTVYTAVPEGQVKPRVDDIEPFNILCGLVECNPSTGWIFYGYPCDRSLASICNDGSIVSENLNWADSRDKCWQEHNSTLMGNQLLTSLECTGNSSYLNKPVWVQMIRDKVTREVDGTNVEPDSTCFGGFVSGSNFTASDISCNSSFVSVCVIDTNTPACDACPFLESDIDVVGQCTTVNTATTTELETTMVTETSPETSTETSPETSTTPSPTTTPVIIVSTQKQTGEKLSSGALAAVIVGGLFALILIVGTFGICRKRAKKAKEMEKNRIKSQEELHYPGMEGFKSSFDAEPVRNTDSVAYDNNIDEKPDDKLFVPETEVMTIEDEKQKESVQDRDVVQGHIIPNEVAIEVNSKPTINGEDSATPPVAEKNEIENDKSEENIPHDGDVPVGVKMTKSVELHPTPIVEKTVTANNNSEENIPNAGTAPGGIQMTINVDSHPTPVKNISKPDGNVKQTPKNVSVINVGKFFEPDINKIEEVTQL